MRTGRNDSGTGNPSGFPPRAQTSGRDAPQTQPGCSERFKKRTNDAHKTKSQRVGQPEPSQPLRIRHPPVIWSRRRIGRSTRDQETVDEGAGSEAGSHGPEGFEMGDNVAAVFGGECPK
jgi:hypothetical protein